MTANQGSPGVSADRVSQFESRAGTPQWDASLPIPPLPLTPGCFDRELPLAGKLILLGLALLLQSALLLNRDWSLIVGAEQTTGSIVDFRSGPRGDRVIAAYAVDGDTYRASAAAKFHNPMYDIGDLVTVSYLAAHPERATIDGIAHVYLVPALLVLLGCTLVLIPAGSLIWSQRHTDAPALSASQRFEAGFPSSMPAR